MVYFTSRGDGMSRQSRTYSESKVYHIMFRGVNYQDLFEERQDYMKLLETILHVKQEMGFDVYAYCFMSNHVHMVLKEQNLRDISLIMKRILTKYSRWYNIKYGRTGALIANRYKSIPVELDEYFLNLIRYVHQNPVKAGIVKDISDYEHSSYKEYISTPILTDTEFVMEMMNLEELKEFHLEIEKMDFEVSDRKKKTDEMLIWEIKKMYKIDNPKQISKMNKTQRNDILRGLKENYPIRQLQRITGVSRGVITKL